MPDIDRLSEQAQAILDAVVVMLGTTDAGAPTSQFLTPAAPAFDCEFVAVQVTRVSEDFTSPGALLDTKKRNVFGNIISISYTIYVIRCAPQISGERPPTDAQKTASAELVLQDGWAIWNGMRDQQEILFDDCLGIYFDGGVPVIEQGGYLGWTFSIRASIEGYVP